MGSDASATLFYGFIAELPESLRDTIDVVFLGESDRWLADLYKVTIPDFPYEPDYSHWDKEKEFKTNNIPIELGYMEDSRLICIRKSVQWALQCVKVIDIEKVRTQPDWDEILKDFCEKSGIPYEKPQWMLYPDYG